MPLKAHPIRDGVIAVLIGGLLALGLLVMARMAGEWETEAGNEPMAGGGQPPVQSADACHIQDNGAGGGSQSDPGPVAGPDFPRQDHDLDTGRPIEVRGSGNAEVAYHRKGDFATVVTFECANCTGELNVFNTGAAMPIVSGETIGDQVEIEWLIDTVHELSQGPDNSLLVRADGDWTLRLRSWHDLPVASGRVEGRGSQVVRVASPQVRMSFAPLNSRDTLNVYAYRLDDRSFRANECIGRFESRVVDLQEGDVLLVWARGEWTIEPT